MKQPEDAPRLYYCDDCHTVVAFRLAPSGEDDHCPSFRCRHREWTLWMEVEEDHRL